MSSNSGQDQLDLKLNDVFDGRVVRKDLLHRIKKGTNVPTFVLEFLLARYCASNEPAEIQVGMDAVLETLTDNYVRPDEANAAQSKVAMQGQHKFIDKVHVRYVEKEKRQRESKTNIQSIEEINEKLSEEKKVLDESIQKNEQQQDQTAGGKKRRKSKSKRRKTSKRRSARKNKKR